jgi:hypothetical protein
MRAFLAWCVLVAGLLLGVVVLVYIALRNPPANPSTDQLKDAPPPSSTENQKAALPDLPKLKRAFDEDFADPANCVLLSPGEPPPTKDAPSRFLGAEMFLHDHRFVILFPPGKGQTVCSVPPDLRHRQDMDFACLLSCRFSGQGEVGWGFIHDDGGRFGVLVSVRPNGGVEVAEYDKEHTAAAVQHPKFGKFPAPIAEPVDGLTHLLVTRQGRKLTVFVNDRAVSNPIHLERGFGPGVPKMALWRLGKGEARAEFTRFAVWRLPETRPETGQ